jgi:serine/threonine protein kinase/Leucine-rich repeat (LRR) protein
MHPQREELLAYVNGSLSESQAESLEGHLQSCPECEATLNIVNGQSDTMIDKLRRSPPPKAADGEVECQAMVQAIKGMDRDQTDPGRPETVNVSGPPDLGSLREYKLLEKLGQGGMGAVYRALHTRLDKVVALKVLNSTCLQKSDSLARFEREMKAVGKLRHPNIVAASDAGEANGTHFLVMELVEGQDLSVLMKKNGPMSVHQAVDCIVQAARGLAYAHSRGIVHRDIKPGNLLLDNEGVLKVLDLGLARFEDPNADQLTSDEQVMGTVDYMSPEQATSTRNVDARGDIYSLGVTLWFLLTGTKMYSGETAVQRIMKHQSAPIPSLTAARTDVSAELAQFFERMVAKTPEYRVQTMDEVVHTLEPMIAETPKTEIAASTPPSRRHRKLLVGAAAAGFLFAMLGIWVIVKDKWGRETGRIEIPDGGKMEVANDGSVTPHKVGVATPASSSREPADNVATPALVKRVDDAWLKLVAALPAEQQIEAVSKKLMELNPGFDGKMSGVEVRPSPKIENGVVTELGFLGIDVSDISPVRALTGLKSFGCFGMNSKAAKLTDLSPLRGMKLNYLSCAGSKVSDLSPLEGMPLKELACQASRVVDLWPLRGMKLSYLNCSATRVSDLEPLAKMPLIVLGCQDSRVADLSPLRGMKLLFLDCSATQVSDLTPLAEMPLETLLCRIPRVADLSPLERCRSLKSLDISKTKVTTEQVAALQKALPNCKIKRDDSTNALAYLDPAFQQWIADTQKLPAEKQIEAVSKKLMELNPGFDGKLTVNDRNFPPKIEKGVVTEIRIVTDDVTDLSPVRALAGLKTLNCGGSEPYKGKLSDLSPLQGMKLTWLECEGTKVADLSPLQGMQLTYLKCGVTSVSDLSPLAGMPLTFLNCSSTWVADLSPVQGMPLTWLDCYGTKVSDLSPIKGMPLTNLSCASTQVSDLTPVEGLKLTSVAISASKIIKGMDVIRRMDSLKTVSTSSGHSISADEFRKRYDAGEFQKAVPNINTPAFQQWLEETQALPPVKQLDAVAKKLQELNPGFDGNLRNADRNGPPKVEQGAVTELGFSADKVSDISPLGALMGLKVLNCSAGQGRVSDLSPLRGLKLTSLSLAENKVDDLSPLVGMPLVLLNIAANHQVIDLSPLRGMPLTSLVCEKTSVSDLSPLQGMPLAELDCRSSQVSDLSPLKNLPLKKLKCSAKVVDLSPLRGMQLALLECSGVADLSPLAGMPLTDLTLGSHKVSDISPLRGMKLTRLICTDTKITDWSPLEGMPLTDLELNGTSISDLSILAGMKLKDLSIGCKEVADLSPLRGMPLKSLMISGSSATDLSPLSGMQLDILYCANTKVADISPLRGMKLGVISLNNTMVSDFSPLRDMRPLGLNCNNTKVSDLSQFEGWTRMTSLNFKGCPVTAEGIAKLQKALPNCKIEWDDPAKAK